MNTSEYQEIPLVLIKVEDRAREEFGDLTELTASVREKGILQPITVNQDYRLLAGERRLRAAKAAGLVTIPSIVRQSNEIDAAEVELIENIYRKDLEWTERVKLEMKIHKLKGGSQRDTADLTGQSVGNVNRHLQLGQAMEVLPQLGEYKTEMDAWKALKKFQEGILVQEMIKRQEVKIADKRLARDYKQSFYEVAQSHYRVEDAIIGLQEWEHSIFDFAEVDPPYGINLDVMKRQDSEVDTSGMDCYSEVSQAGYANLIHDVAEQVDRLLVANAFCIWWFGHSNYQATLDTLKKWFEVTDVPAIWHKIDSGHQTNQPYLNLGNAYESFFVCRKGNPSLAKPGRSNVFDFAAVPPAQKIHPTEKPLELMLELFDTFCHPNMKLLIPFLGSGVTLRATYRRQTWGVGWDLAQANKDRFLLKVKEDEESGVYKRNGA